jgi:opacity protein-like surface antigen
MRRLSIACAFIALVSVLAPSSSYAQQSVSFSIGGFNPHGFDARDRQDVLLDDSTYLAFKMDDFHGLLIGGEYLVGIGDWIEGGLGVGLYSNTVPSVYTDYINANGSEIEQDLHLRMVPFTATMRFLPLGRGNGVEPYIGAGVAIVNWHYSETGDFVDFTDGSIFPARYEGSGTATGPTILGGVRVPFGSWAVGGEIRWQDVVGDLPLDQFLVPKIDLGGWSYAATFSVRF